MNVNHQFLSLVLSGNHIMWIESKMLWTALNLLNADVYQNQLLNVPQWKLTSDELTFLIELSSAACCISILSKTIIIISCRRLNPLLPLVIFKRNIGKVMFYGSRSNRPQTKSSPSQIDPKLNRPSQIGPRSNHCIVMFFFLFLIFKSLLFSKLILF